MKLYQPKLREENVLLEIMQRLTYMGIKVYRIRERIPEMVRGRKFFRGGASTAGIPDLIGHVPEDRRSGILFSPARVVYIEVKRPGGKRRLMQELFIEEAKKDGCIAFFADSWEVVKENLTACGVVVK